VQIEGVGFHAVELPVGTHFGLALVEVRLSPGLAVELLNVVGARVKQVAVVGLLVTRGESAEDQDVFVRDLVKTAPLEANPVRVLLYPQVQGLPVLSSLNVILFDQIGALPAVEASYHVEGLVVKGNSGVEITTSV